MISRFTNNRFLRNVASLQFGAMLNGVGGITSAVLLAHLLGAEQMGEYYSAIAMYGALVLVVNVGLVQVTVNQLAGASVRGLEEKVAGWLAFLVKSYLVLGLVLPVLGWFVLPWIGSVVTGADVAVGADGGETPRIVHLARILSFTALVELPQKLVCAAFQGTRRMTMLAKTENVHEMTRVICVGIGCATTFTATGPIVGTLVASALGSVLALELYREGRQEPGDPLPSLGEILRMVPRIPLMHGLPLCLRIGALRNIDALAFDVLPPLILRTFAGPEVVAYFKVAHRIMNVPMMFMQGISRTALPAMSALRGLKDMDAFRVQWTRVTVYGGGIMASGILLTLPLIPFVVGLAFPDDYVAPVWRLALILAVGFVPSAFCVALDSFFIVADRLKVAIGIGLVGVLACVGTALLLSGTLPQTGTAWGYAFAKAWPAVSLIYIWVYFRRHRSDGTPPGQEPAPAVEGARG